LQLYSEDFRNIAEGGATNTWTPNDTLILSTNNTAPDGTLTATRIRGNGSNRARQAVIFGTMGAPYSGSIFIRRVSGSSTIELRVGDVSQVSSINPTSSWQRFTHTASPTSTAIRLAVVFSNNTDEFEIWGAQLEDSSYPTSYIPTTSASATRVADACSKTGISSLIGQTEGTIFVDVQDLAQETFLFSFNESISSSVSILKNASNEIQCQVWGSVLVTIFSSAVSNIRLKIAFAYKSGSLAVYINGVQAGTSATTFTLGTTMDTIYLPYRGTYYAISQTALYNQVALFKTRLTNAELASLTTI
jgi:hypothetical protein